MDAPSASFPRFTAATIPRGIPAARATAIPSAPHLCRYRKAVGYEFIDRGILFFKGSPHIPMKEIARYLTYWAGSGSFETIFFGNLLQDFFRHVPLLRRTERTPGMTCIRKNVMVIRINRDNTPATKPA